MKTHTQTRCLLIVVCRLAGLAALIASIVNLLGAGEGEVEWRLNMCMGLGWWILATLEECEARLRDANEYGISVKFRQKKEVKE